MQGIKKIFTRSALAAVVATGVFLPFEAAACTDESYTGSVCFVATDWCPRNWVQANGQELQVIQYQALFSLLGYAYGGNGQSTFGVPDLRGRAPVGTGTGPGLPAVARAAKVGQAVLNVTVPVPYHTHTAVFTPSGTTQGTGTTPVVVPTITGTGQTVSGITITNTLALIATTKGSLNIASSSSAGGVSIPANGAVLARPSAGAPNIYNAGAAANTTIGPEQTFTGNVTGTVTSVASGGIVNGTPNIPSFTLDVPTTVTQGTVAVAAAGSTTPMAVNTQSPGLGMTACIMSNGLYPQRP